MTVNVCFMAVKIGKFFILSEGVRFKASDNKIDLLKRIFRTKRNKRNLGETSVVFFSINSFRSVEVKKTEMSRKSYITYEGS